MEDLRGYAQIGKKKQDHPLPPPVSKTWFMGRGAEEIAAFAIGMSETLNLEKNAEKGAWHGLRAYDLREKLREEIQEVEFAMKAAAPNNTAHLTDEQREMRLRELASECFDAANVLMMICDCYGALGIHPATKGGSGGQ